MSEIFNSTMTTESSSLKVANEFERSGDPAVLDMSPKMSTAPGEVSISLPVLTPGGLMAFQDWKAAGWDGEGGTKTNPGEEDYKHEPVLPGKDR